MIVYAGTSAAVMNGDGLAYYYRVLSDDWQQKLLPGHLMYCPMFTLAHWLLDAAGLEASLGRVMLMANVVAGACGILLVFRTAQRLGVEPFAQWWVALGLACSYGYWIQAADVETYALAALLVIASVHRMAVVASSLRAKDVLVLGALNGLAGLLHLATLALGPTSVLLIVWLAWRRRGPLVTWLAGYGAAFAVVFGVPVLGGGFVVLELATLGDVWQWLRSSEHQYRIVFDVLSVPRAVYGFVRTFLFLEFFYGAPRWMIALKAGAFVAAAASLAWWMLRRGPRFSDRAKIVLGSAVPFVLAQALLGVYFFGSDTERWVFIAPLVWLALGGGLPLTATRRRALGAGLGLLFAVNLAQGIWPAHTDASIRHQALALDATVSDDAVIVTPGQDWTSYLRYYTRKSPETVSLIEMALVYRDDHRGFYQHLRRVVSEAREGRRPLVVLRILDPTENLKVTPWQELAAFGYTAEMLRQALADFRWEEQRLSDPDRTPIYWLR